MSRCPNPTPVQGGVVVMPHTNPGGKCTTITVAHTGTDAHRTSLPATGSEPLIGLGLAAAFVLVGLVAKGREKHRT